MVNFFKEFWFGILMFSFVFICMVFVLVIAVAPHNDAEMRGFTPCTYEMAESFGNATQADFKLVVSVVSKGYKCYFSVMGEGVKQYFAGKQPTPWANYLFEPIILDTADNENIESIPQDVLDSNMLDGEDAEDTTLFGDIQENDDEK